MTADDTVDGLEALRSGGTEPQHLDDTKLRQVYPRFCSLQTANGHIGTGFLVGPRRILTAYHVYQQAQGAGGLKFAIFDYAPAQSQGGPQAKKLRLQPQPLAGSPARERDYAIFELVDDPGSPRGFFELTSLTLVNDQQVFVVGHPGEFQSTVPQARSLTTTVGHIRDHNSQIHRLAHSADTTPGSSGSAVLTVDLQLVGLHHHGEPGAGQNNHAIPIWSILEHLIGTKEDCRFSLVQLSKQSSRKLRVAMDLKTDARIDSIPESLRTYVPAASLEDSSAGLEPLATENVAIDTTVSIQSETVRPGSFPSAVTPAESSPTFLKGLAMSTASRGRDAAVIVYCRLLHLGENDFKNDRIAYAVRQLRAIIQSELAAFDGRHKPPVASEERSSVYGRFAVLPGSPGEALDFACAVMAKARDAKVALTIGVAQGPILPTTDALGGNIAGIAINQAARLAFLDSAHCFIAVEAPVAQQAFDDRTRPDWSFNPPIPQPPENRKVKQTELSFRSIKEISPEPPVSPADAPHELGARSENACVINVDIVKYSQNDLREMVVVAFRLLHEGLTHANQSTGGNPAPRGRYYAPGGDGGVFVYRDGEGGGLSEAWSFIKSLWDECRDSVAIRIGVAFQSVVLIDNEYPVGKGVLVADKLSAEAQIDAICSDREFWEHDLIKPKRRSWQQTEHLAESGVMAYLVSDRCTPVVPKPIEVQQWVEKHRQRIEETLLGFCDTALLREIFEALHPNEPTEGDQGKLARRVASTLTSEPGLQRNGPIGHLNALRRRWTVSQRTLEMERLRLVLDYTLPIRIHRATARDIVRQWRAGAKIIVGTATAWGSRVVMALLTTEKRGDATVGRSGFSKLMGQIVNPAIGIEPLVFNDPNQILSQMVFGISKHVSFQGSGPCPQRDDDPRLEEYCARLNNRLAWFAEENGCEFFLFVTDLDREFGIHRRDQIVAKLRRWVPEICLLQLNPAADSRYDEDDLDNLISVGF